MKQVPWTMAVLAMAFVVSPVLGQGFSTGSDGSDGALDVTANTTLALPADGIFHFTTVRVAPGVTLSFSRNALNTPVYLLATGDVTIEGTISVNGANGSTTPPVGGAGGPGGFDGGMPGFIDLAPGAGYGPGAGLGGAGGTAPGAAAYAGVSNAGTAENRGAVYGSPLLVPLLGGSGGGGNAGSPGTGGAGGGGAILLASNTRIVLTGAVTAVGGSMSAGSATGHGSGGAVRFLAPEVSGTGTVNVNGGNWVGSGGHGRIRVDTIDRRNLRFSFSPLSAVNVGAFMTAFLDPNPRLDIVEAAGTVIAEGATAPVYVQLPFNANPARTVTVRARDFGGVVPIRVVLTPDRGVPIVVDDQIDNTTVNPAQKTVNVTLPVNVLTRVTVWTR